MQFSDLANELVLHILQSCDSIPDVLNLAATCHHVRMILASQRLPTLFLAAEAQFGPLADATRLVTHNASQPAHIPRPSPPISLALLNRLVSVGRVANKWVAIYPRYKWRSPYSASRRLLTSAESYCLRRACYRLWLYTLAFHTRLHPGITRHSPPIVHTRATLLRPWPTPHLAEMLDLQSIFRQVLDSKICPSNGTVRRRHVARFPDSNPAVGLRYNDQTVQLARQRVRAYAHVYNSPLFAEKPAANHDEALGGWGDEISQYYVVEDMLKLDPGQLLFLLESVTGIDDTGVGTVRGSRLPAEDECGRVEGAWGLIEWPGGGGTCGVVESFVSRLDDWFENNGETCKETVAWVLEDRNEDVEKVKEEMGIVMED